MNSGDRVALKLVRDLIDRDFPHWRDLPLSPIKVEGKGNHAFRLGPSMVVRLPKTATHALQVEKETKWLPLIAPLLPLPVPEVLAVGKPSDEYPWHWVIYNWIEGNTFSSARAPVEGLAKTLALFIKKLHNIELSGGPVPGTWGSNRGGPLKDHHQEILSAIRLFKGQQDTFKIEQLWNSAMETRWSAPPVWIHADLTASNILVQHGKLKAVIDFGKLTMGDPAYDLSVAWTLFNQKERELFQSILSYDEDTWLRARAWAMRKALVHASGLKKRRSTYESLHCFEILNRIF